MLEGGGALDPVPDIEISGIEYDSRACRQGTLFCAFAGSRADGASFAEDALENGAAAVLSEAPRPAGFRGAWIRVEHGRRALAIAARRYYASIARELTLTGVTGTNGKTTTAALVDSVLRRAGRVTALIGTTGYEIAGEVRDSINTTPESIDLYRLLRDAAVRGATHGVMEVSSHALALGRVWAVRFDVAIFTNLTRDHLDFHPTMEAYFEAKRELFRGQGAPPPRAAAINAGDEWGRRIEPDRSVRTILYGDGPGAELRAENVRAGFDGLSFDAIWEGRRFPVRSPLGARFNVDNILAAFAAGVSHGIAPETILEGIASRTAVAGRFERVDEGQSFLVAVDYAHTDDALRNAIRAARELTKGRVITLFGCGGDRDRAKRPLMGEAAARLSDFVVVTSDNPRSEDPLGIINDAMVGVRRTDTGFAVEPDRGKAIRLAIGEARPGDVVLLAGKGHETYQVLKSGKIHFDDREAAREALRSLGVSGRRGA